MSEVALIALSVGTRAPSLQYRVCFRKGRVTRGQVYPRSGQSPENTDKMRRSIVPLPVLYQEHPLTQHVTSEVIPFGNITANYYIIFVTLFWFWTRDYYGPSVND